MRPSTLLASFSLLTALAAPLFAQGAQDLREDIRRIVREEVRAALRDAMQELHGDPAATPARPGVRRTMLSEPLGRGGLPGSASAQALDGIEGKLQRLGAKLDALEAELGDPGRGEQADAKRVEHGEQGFVVELEDVTDEAAGERPARVRSGGGEHGLIVLEGESKGEYAAHAEGLRRLLHDGEGDDRIIVIGEGDQKGEHAEHAEHAEGLLRLLHGGEGSIEFRLEAPENEIAAPLAKPEQAKAEKAKDKARQAKAKKAKAKQAKAEKAKAEKAKAEKAKAKAKAKAKDDGDDDEEGEDEDEAHEHGEHGAGALPQPKAVRFFQVGAPPRAATRAVGHSHAAGPRVLLVQDGAPVDLTPDVGASSCCTIVIHCEDGTCRIETLGSGEAPAQAEKRAFSAPLRLRIRAEGGDDDADEDADDEEGDDEADGGAASCCEGCCEGTATGEAATSCCESSAAATATAPKAAARGKINL